MDLVILMGALIFLFKLWEEFTSPDGISSSQLIITGSVLFCLTGSASDTWNRLRYPLLEIDDEEIRFCPLNRFFFRPIYRVLIREIDAVLPSKESSLVLRLRSGKVRKFTLFELRKRDRKPARDAIERRLRAAQRSGEA
jgi:hypothetical protein